MCRFLICIVTALALHAPLLACAETAPAPQPITVAPASPVISGDTALPRPVPAEKRFRVGYVDVLKIAGESDAGKVAKTHFEAKADRLKSQIDTKQKLLEKQKATLEAKLPSYTPEQRAAKIKEYEKKLEELKKLLQKADKEIRPLQEELFKEVYSKIESAARAYGAANGFSAIIEKREILYLGQGIDAEDVTSALVQEMNKK